MTLHHKDKLKFPVNIMCVDQDCMQKQTSKAAYSCTRNPKVKGM